MCATDINLPINITDLFPTHLIDFCSIYPGNVFSLYIGQDYPEIIYVSHLPPFKLIDMGRTYSSLAGWHII